MFSWNVYEMEEGGVIDFEGEGWKLHRFRSKLSNNRFTRLKNGRKEVLGIKIKEWSWAGRD